MIFRMMPPDGYEGVICMDDDHGYEYVKEMDGKSCADHWHPVPVKRYTEGEDNRPSDFPWLVSHALVMRRRAVDALRDMFEAGGEILPLATDDDVELFLLNVTRVIDALDLASSQVWRFPGSGRIGSIDAAAFHEPLVRDVDFFKLPILRANEIFVGERFIERVQAAGLVGLAFELAWSPERGAIKQRLW